MDPERIWRTGDKVRVKHEGREVDGEVMLSSGNGRALVLSFEAILGGHVGTMPVLWLESLGAEGGFASLLCMKPVELSPPVDPSGSAP